MAGYVAYPYPGFGRGLNLRDKEDALEEDSCIDCLNVEFTTRGAVKQRAGYEALTDPALTNAVGSLHPFYTTGGTKHLIAGCGTRLEALNTSGAVVASLTGQTSGTWDFARFGAPGSELIYAGQGSTTLRKWDGSSWTNGVANTPAAGALAVMAVDQGNRLVAGRFNTTTGGPTGGAATSNPSRVYFSDPGDPETWGTNNYIDFTPGDGEGVQAIVAWREYVFVFKKTKYFRIDGQSEDADGNPIFHYTTFDTGVGCAAPKAICSNERGVYFLAEDGTGHGIYATNGGEPVEISDLVQPIFSGETSAYYTGGTIDHDLISSCAMGALDDRIYLAFTADGGSANDRVLVYDTNYEWWSLWDIPASCFADFAADDHSDLVFGYSSGSNDVGRYHAGAINDDGAAIESHWRSGWFDLGLPDQKRIREYKVWGNTGGTENLTTALAAEFIQGTGFSDTLDLAGSPDTWSGTTWGGGEWAESEAPITVDMALISNRGTVFSLYFQNTTLDTTWSVNRCSLHIADQRFPSTTRTENT